MAKNPSDIFYWNDLENDPGWRACSYAARGLWMGMLCIMSRACPKGYLLTPSGQPLPMETLARMTGGQLADVEALMAELEANGVYATDRHHRIYNRRMVRAAQVSDVRSAAGKVGAIVTNGKRSDKIGLPQQNGDKPIGKGSANGSANGSASSLLPIPPIVESVLTGADARPETPDEKFERWWKFVPNKVAKGQALKAFRGALKKTDYETLEAGIKKYAYEKKGDDKNYIKHPATWLNGMCWLDEDQSHTGGLDGKRVNGKRPPETGFRNGFCQLFDEMREGSGG